MIIRLARDSDCTAIAEIYDHYVKSTIVSFEYIAPDADEMASRMRDVMQVYPWLVAEENGLVLAYAYGSPHRARRAYRWSCDVSVYAHHNHHRRGVGRTLYQALLALLKEQGFANAFAGIALPNDPSIGLHEALGFHKIGIFEKVGHKFDSWHDVGWWSCALQEDDYRPHEPIAIDRLDPSFVANIVDG